MGQSADVDFPIDSLFGAQPEETPAALAAALVPPAAPGHYDELRGGVPAPLSGAALAGVVVGGHALPTRAWARFFENLGRDGFGDLDRRRALLQRQIRDQGVSTNLHAGAAGASRPWSVDLFPLILGPGSWQRIEAGVLQRARLLERILDDVYGPQELLARRLLPPALVQGHPGYLRAMQGVRRAGGRRLHVAAFDLVRDPAGAWWVVGQRAQAPAGLGYLLENRLAVARLFPEAFRDLKVQRLAASYRALLESLLAACPADAGEPRIVLLTPGPAHESWFEHASLARYLGLALVEGSDLTVRGNRLYLKTLQGLQRVHGLIRRLDDAFLDPLELRADSHLGVPGLLHAIRAGQVLVANAPGAGWLESPGLLAFLPAVARALLGEELQLPAVASWWCGERAALDAALPQLAACVIHPTWGGEAPVPGERLSPQQRAAWAERIRRDPDRYTLQATLRASQMPTWQPAEGGGRAVQRSLVLRVFAVADGADGWRVLPGGLARLAGGERDTGLPERAASSADTWVLTEGEVDRTSLLPREDAAGAPHRSRVVTSRAAEHLFWLGRYTERTENTGRLARLALQALNGEDQGSQPLLAWIDGLARSQALVPAGTPAAMQARHAFERALLTALPDADGARSVGFNLHALREAAAGLRERLSQEHWNLVMRAEEDFQRGCAGCASEAASSPVEALRVLEALSAHTAALTGAQTDRMTRDEGWRLLSIGRHLERLGFLAQALASAFETGAVADDAGFEAVLTLFDSSLTFHAHYQQRHDRAALLDLLVLDRENPRSLGWVVQTLRQRLARLAAAAPGVVPAIAEALPDPAQWQLATLCRRDAGGRHADLLAVLRQAAEAAWELSDQLGARYFAHAIGGTHSVGA